MASDLPRSRCSSLIARTFLGICASRLPVGVRLFGPVSHGLQEIVVKGVVREDLVGYNKADRGMHLTYHWSIHVVVG